MSTLTFEKLEIFSWHAGPGLTLGAASNGDQDIDIHATDRVEVFAGVALDRAVRRYAAQHRIEYVAALAELRDDPDAADLFAAYANGEDVEVRPVQMKCFAEQPNGRSPVEQAGDEVDRRTQARMREHGLKEEAYSATMHAVLAEDHDLAERYSEAV